MVVYLHVFVEKTSQDLIQDIRLDPQETNAYMWLDLKEVNYTCDYSISLNKDDSIIVHELKNDSAVVVQVMKNYDILRADLPTSGTFDVERISTGTRFALEQFYARKENSSRLWKWKKYELPKRKLNWVYLFYPDSDVFVEKSSKDLIQDIRLDPQESNFYIWLDLKKKILYLWLFLIFK